MPTSLRAAWEQLQSPAPLVDEGLESLPSDPLAAALHALDADYEGAIASLARLEWRGDDAWDADQELPLVLERATGPRVETPRDLAQLRTILRDATERGLRVRARGAEHSFSGINRGDDIGIDMLRLRGRLSLDAHPFAAGVRAADHVAVLGGTRIRALNQWLVKHDRALLNLGNYDQQALAGAIATDTHGTGLDVGPLSALVASLHLVIADGGELRIERGSSPLTDRVRWDASHPDVPLIQDDDAFAAAVVGLGCMGVVYSLVLRTVPVYWLRERREIREWSEVAADLRSGAFPATDARCSVAINPYRFEGARRCLVTVRTVEADEPADRTYDERNRTFWAALASPSNVLARPIIERQLKPRQGRAKAIHRSLPRLVDDVYVSRWDKVLITGNPPVRAESMEVGVPLEHAAEAVEAVLDRLDPDTNGDSFWPTSPINLRFVMASEAWMSPMYGRATCMIEVPFLWFQWEDAAEEAEHTLADLERMLIQRFDGRPHWGKRWWLEGVDLATVFPQVERWLRIRRELDPDWTFANQRTDALRWSTPRTP